MTEEEFEAMIAHEIAHEEWRRSPEGLAEESRIEAEIEAHLAEMAALDAEYEARFKALKEAMND